MALELFDWVIYLVYYKDGKEIEPLMQLPMFLVKDSEEEVEETSNLLFYDLINKDYIDPIDYSPIPQERVEGFVYEGVRVKRTPETIQEFLELEKTTKEDVPIQEIWKYSFKETWRGIKTYTEHPDGTITVVKSEIVS